MSIHKKTGDMKVFAKRALLDNEWSHNVRVTMKDGRITKIDVKTAAASTDIRVDTLLPALSNLHSHSFQRAMAGMTEYRAKSRESFWTWRDLMYRFVERLSPEHVFGFAALAFMEMQKAGYASVGEFHYVHHQPDGKAYDNPAELSHQIMAAAKLAGIGLTHLPVLYTYGGLKQQPLTGGQLRFGNSVDQITDIVSRSRDKSDDMPLDFQVGVAPHSLRAITPENLNELLEQHPSGPVHIHIAEQVQEVEEISEHLGDGPVKWLLNNAEIDDRWCLIHATHMTDDEVDGMARSGAVAGLCPITEANLGDGIFPGSAFLKSGGKYGVGTDSNVNISMIGELRSLEYSQRLRNRSRNVMVDGPGSVGTALYLGAATGGAKALGRNSGRIAVGAWADVMAIDTSGPALCALSDAQVLDGLLFAANDTVVTDVWSAGRHQVKNRHHVAEEMIVANYRKLLRELVGSLG